MIRQLIFLTFSLCEFHQSVCAALASQKKQNADTKEAVALILSDFNQYNQKATTELSQLFKANNFDENKILNLLRAKANPNIKVDGQSILIIAVKNQKKNIKALLLKYGAIPNECDENGVSAVAYIDSPEDAEIMLQNDKFLGPDRFGNNPLHLLVSSSRSGWSDLRNSPQHALTVAYYVKRGVDKNALSKADLTPLMTAVSAAHLDMVIALYKQNVDMDKQNRAGNTALDLVAEYHRAEPEGKKKQQYLMIWNFLYNIKENNLNFFDKSFDQIIDELSVYGVRIVQKNGQSFGEVWSKAQSSQDKGLAVTYLITALFDKKKYNDEESNDLPESQKKENVEELDELLDAAKEFIKDHAQDLSAFVRERSLERIKELKEQKAHVFAP